MLPLKNNMSQKKKIVVAISGASGSMYAKLLLDQLKEYGASHELEVGVVMSKNAKDVWKHELQNEAYEHYPFSFFDKMDFNAPFASGSAQYTTMIVCPCSMGTLARIAQGTSNDLVTRAADVILKERRKLILVTRETPLNLIHIKNMEAVTLAGGIVLPASPSFYSIPKNMEQLSLTVVNRILDLAEIENKGFRWNS